MDIRHKKKAMIGLAIWIGAVPLGILVGGICEAFNASAVNDARNALSGAIFVCLLIVHYFSFFWAGGHLAKAKGYSSAIVVPGIFWPAQLVIIALLLFALRDKYADRSRSRDVKKHRERESTIARVVRCRRNAFVANLFGAIGILIALALFFLPLGLFETRDNARVAAVLTFVPSYSAVIYGCYWWVRAKHWHEAVVFIGLMPLAPLAIPFVRLVYIRTPLLPVGMVIMPIILISVVAVLPDKSGLPRRKRWDRD